MASPERFLRKLAIVRDALAQSPFLPDSVADAFNAWAGANDLALPSVDVAPLGVASALANAFVPPGVASGSAKDAARVHPFSGASAALPRRPDDDALHDTLAAALAALDLPDDASPHTAFVAVWRNLLPLLRAHSPDDMAGLWDRLPAHPHLPDHSLFQHVRVATAFADAQTQADGLQTNAAFVLFTIGPVKQFIQQARKTKDLYWGSYLLSHLCWTGIQEVIQHFGPDAVIFPDLYGQPLVDRWIQSDLKLRVENSQAHHHDLPTLPNRFFAVIDAPSDEAVKKTLTDVSDVVQKAWVKRGEALFRKKRFRRIQPPDAFDRHMEQALSTYWAGIRLQPGKTAITPAGTLDRVGAHVEPSVQETVRERLEQAHAEASPATRFGLLYDALYTLTEKRLGAQKTVRAFAQLRKGAGERGRKCSLCGERNTLFHRGHPAQIGYNEGATDMKDHADLVHLREGEGLCGVCFTKRFADHVIKSQRGTFDATADIATAPMRAADRSSVALCENKMKGVLSEAAGPGRFDRQLLYKENLTPDYLGTFVFPERANDRAFLDGVATELQAIHDNALSDAAKDAQSSYYAIIALDGDNMGKWLSGAKAPDLERLYPDAVWEALDSDVQDAIRKIGARPMTPAVHATMSQALAAFALQQVRPIVEDHNGFLVYAGGDDVLAFVSVDAVLDVLIELRAAFSGHRTADGTVDFTNTPTGFLDAGDRLLTTLGPAASASAGVAIAHYKAPLGMVLDTAYAMEKKAKDAGRDRAAIAVLKRSGERNEAVLPFRAAAHPTVNPPEGLLAVFRELVADLQAQDISPTFMRTIRRELYPLMDRKHGTLGDFPIADDFLRAELYRLIRRKSNAEADWANATADRLVAAYRATDAHLKTFLSALDIVLFLHKETLAAHAPVDYAA